MVNPLCQLGRWTIEVVQGSGRAVLFLLEALMTAFLPPFRPRRVLQEIYSIGVKSTLIMGKI